MDNPEKLGQYHRPASRDIETILDISDIPTYLIDGYHYNFEYHRLKW